MSRKGGAAKSFTFREVAQEKVALQLNANMTGVQELNDSLVFLLKADDTQPARGEFHFTVVPYDPELFPTTASPAPTTSSARLTPVKTTKNETASTVLSAVVHSTQQPSKNQQRYKGRNRWGNSNRTNVLSTTLNKLPNTEDFPFRNTPVRVESYPQKTSNPLLVILPLLALLLLVIIFVVLVVYLRHHKRRKQSTATPEEPTSAANPSVPLYQGATQRSATVPIVTVTPLSSTCPGSPAFDRLLTANRSSPYNTIDSNMFVSSWSNNSPAASSQIIRTATPTLRKNQYWV